jgi:hypothetical protein
MTQAQAKRSEVPVTGRNVIPQHVREMFQLAGPAIQLAAGSRPAYRVGSIVIKKLHARSLETGYSLELAPWIAGELAELRQDGFRLACPIAARDSHWMLEGYWTAWTFVEGRPALCRDVPEAIVAIRALHRALRHIPKHPLLDQNTTAWGFAHRHCWTNQPRRVRRVHPVVAGLVAELCARYQPLPPLPCQLIHGDLNAENILIEPGQPPGFIDFTPFWAPADFAIAMLAN